MYKYVNEAETILKLFQCFISPCSLVIFLCLCLYMLTHSCCTLTMAF